MPPRCCLYIRFKWTFNPLRNVEDKKRHQFIYKGEVTVQCHLLIYKGGFIVQCHLFVITLYTDENIEIYLFICKEAVIAQWNPFVYLFTSKAEVIVQCSLIVNGMRHMLDQFSLNKILIIRSSIGNKAFTGS